MAQPGAPRVNILGVGISAIDMAGALAIIEGWITRREQHYVCVASVHGVMECQRDSALREVFNGSGLTTPDGMPLVWWSRLRGFRHVRRVYGPDLMLALCGRSVAAGHRHYLYGGAPGVADALAARWRRRFPGLRIVGTYSPPFRPLSGCEDAGVCRAINRVNPDIVWVGLSTPKEVSNLWPVTRWICNGTDGVAGNDDTNGDGCDDEAGACSVGGGAGPAPLCTFWHPDTHPQGNYKDIVNLSRCSQNVYGGPGGPSGCVPQLNMVEHDDSCPPTCSGWGTYGSWGNNTGTWLDLTKWLGRGWKGRIRVEETNPDCNDPARVLQYCPNTRVETYAGDAGANVAGSKPPNTCGPPPGRACAATSRGSARASTRTTRRWASTRS
jgi:exopolysaccharide biosynthesis WecB/TagA/CpsF family protein